MEDETKELLINWASYDTPIWTVRTDIPEFPSGAFSEAFVSPHVQRLLKRTGRDLNSEVNVEVHA